MLLPIISPTISINAVNFDGTNDYLARGADLTGLADGEIATISMWVYIPSAAADTSMGFIGTAFPYFVFYSNGKDFFRLVGRDSGNTTRLQLTITQNFHDDAWHHFAISFDKNDTLKRHVYVDGVDVDGGIASWDTYDATNNIDFTRGDFEVGAFSGGSSKLDGDLAEVWFDDSYIDLSNSANLAKFIQGGSPVNLGDDGSIPTGNSPLLFLSGETDNWHTNKGTGGGFTENGALTDGTLPVAL